MMYLDLCNYTADDINSTSAGNPLHVGQESSSEKTILLKMFPIIYNNLADERLFYFLICETNGEITAFTVLYVSHNNIFVLFCSSLFKQPFTLLINHFNLIISQIKTFKTINLLL